MDEAEEKAEEFAVDDDATSNTGVDGVGVFGWFCLFCANIRVNSPRFVVLCEPVALSKILVEKRFLKKISSIS